MEREWDREKDKEREKEGGLKGEDGLLFRSMRYPLKIH